MYIYEIEIQQIPAISKTPYKRDIHIAAFADIGR
jgi:hypothetical protein